MVIIVSLTALADFTAPSYDFSFPLRILRFYGHFQFSDVWVIWLNHVLFICALSLDAIKDLWF
ncbi:spore germination protein [Bacillus sp. SL00103]